MVEIGDDQHRRRPATAFCLHQQLPEPVQQQLPVGRAGEIVVDRIMQQPLRRRLGVGDVADRAGAAHDLAVGPHDRPGLEREPVIMAVTGAQPECLVDFSAPLIDDRIEHNPVAVAVGRMQQVEPVPRRAFQRPVFQSQYVLYVLADLDPVARHVPVPDCVTGADQGERLLLGVGNQALRQSAAGEGMLHDGKGRQHDNKNQATGQCRLQRGVVDLTGYRQPGRADPEDQYQPGRDQHDGPVIIVQRQIEDDEQADNGGAGQRQPRRAGGDCRIDEDDAEKHGQADQPDQRDMTVADMPAVEVQIGVEENKQRRRQHDFRRRPPGRRRRWRQIEDPAPEAEINGDIGQHRPGQRRRRRKHRRAAHDEQHRQKQRQQGGYAQNDAAIKGVAVDRFLKRLGLPQMQLRQVRRPQFNDEGDNCAWVERYAENV